MNGSYSLTNVRGVGLGIKLLEYQEAFLLHFPQEETAGAQMS